MFCSSIFDWEGSQEHPVCRIKRPTNKQPTAVRARIGISPVSRNFQKIMAYLAGDVMAESIDLSAMQRLACDSSEPELVDPYNLVIWGSPSIRFDRSSMVPVR
jgi:hypothetical protein